MSQLTSILLAPYHFFFGENGFFSSSAPGSRGETSQAFYKGIPALLFAIFGLLFLIVGELNAGKTLIQKYEDDLAVIVEEESQLKKDLSQELQMAQANNKELEIETPEIGRLRDRLAELLESKKILLSKLHSLAPEQGKYQFQLANTFFTKSELAQIMPVSNENDKRIRQELANSLRKQGTSIMKQLAPEDKPGYLEAHLYLANNSVPKGSLSPREQARLLRLADKHLDHALVRDDNNTTALSMKVLIAEKFGQFDKAKIHLKKLFETDPYVYPQLCQLNARLGVTDEEKLSVLHSARVRLSGQLDRMTGSSDIRIKCATFLVDTYHRLENIDEADRVVNDEIRKFQDIPKVQLWGKRLTAISQEIRYNASGPITSENAEEMIGYLRNGYEHDPSNQKILGHLAQLQGSDIPEVSKLSKEIYQPGEKAPASVENILGAQALVQKDYLKAAKHITRATQKDQKNGDYLNNLAYLYLVRPNPDPQESLKLIDRAIINAQSSGRQLGRLTHYYDTKGKALLALGKIAEEKGNKTAATNQYAAATAYLLKALINRPNDLEISKAIVECYEANGQTEMAEIWAEQVKQLEIAKAAEAAQDNN